MIFKKDSDKNYGVKNPNSIQYEAVVKQLQNILIKISSLRKDLSLIRISVFYILGKRKMIDEIDYFPKRERHNKQKKSGSGWSDLKKQKNKQDENPSDETPLSEKKPHEKNRN